MGQKITTLVSGRKGAGHHTVVWDASGMASGIYYYRLETGSFSDMKRMLLLK